MQWWQAQLLLYACMRSVGWAMHHGSHNAHLPGIQSLPDSLCGAENHLTAIRNAWLHPTGECKAADAPWQLMVVQHTMQRPCSLGSFVQAEVEVLREFTIITQHDTQIFVGVHDGQSN